MSRNSTSNATLEVITKLASVATDAEFAQLLKDLQSFYTKLNVNSTREPYKSVLADLSLALLQFRGKIESSQGDDQAKHKAYVSLSLKFRRAKAYSEKEEKFTIGDFFPSARDNTEKYKEGLVFARDLFPDNVSTHRLLCTPNKLVLASLDYKQR